MEVIYVWSGDIFGFGGITYELSLPGEEISIDTA
jgi:hypothetical protein